MTDLPFFPNVVSNQNYTIKLDHRNKSKDKSQWSVSHQDEVFTIFKNAYTHTWVSNNNAWGIFFNNGGLDYLGVAQDHVTQVFIAKFFKDVNHDNWHGYPADHQSNQQDIPDQAILNDWLVNKILPKAKISKIQGGKRCKL
jgi:hypothetical protein